METRFVYRKSKETIFFSIQLEKRFYKSTGIKLKFNEWGKGFPKAISKTKEIRETLNKWKNIIDKFSEKTVEEKNRKPTNYELSVFVENLIKGKPQKNIKTIDQIIEDFILEQTQYLNVTTIRYKKIHLKHFCELIKGKRRTLADLTHEVLSDYQKKLIKEARENTTTNNYLKTIKSFINWLKKNKLTNIDLSENLQKLKELEKNVIALNENEIEILENASGLPEHLQNQLDIFLFGCYTALSISDIKKLNKDMIQGNFIVIRRSKTEKPLKIPIINEAKEILLKHDFQLPCISDNKGNENLKKAFKMLGLDRNVTISSKNNQLVIDSVRPLHEVISWHKARKTAITTAIVKGIPISAVMMLSGHSKYETMKKYIDYANDELATLMNEKMSKSGFLRVQQKEAI
jgi:integrase